MNPHTAMVIATGLMFVASSMALGVVVRLLGPTFHTKVTAPWPVIGFFFIASAGLFWRGVTFLFPGDLVSTDQMSLIVPLEAAIVLGLCVVILDWVMGDRAPPPLLFRYFGWAIRPRLSDERLTDLAFTLPPAMHVAAPPEAQISRTGRKTRLFVLTGGALIILAALGVIAASAAV